MGELIYQAPKPIPPHKHDYPEINWENHDTYTLGSIWQCECGKQFKVSAISQWYGWQPHDPNAPVPRGRAKRHTLGGRA